MRLRRDYANRPRGLSRGFGAARFHIAGAPAARKRSWGGSLWLLVVLIVAGFSAQLVWMGRHTRGKDADKVISPDNPIARFLHNTLLEKKGLGEGNATAGEPAAGTENISCPWCFGIGQVRADGEAVLCPICLGVGSHAVRRIAGDELICIACDGMGRLVPEGGAGEAETCPRCNGRGLVERKKTAEE